LALLSLATLLALAPFSARAFNIDESLFLWTAEQIQREPLDFYGFEVNWYGESEPMHAVTKNPPLASYFIAAVAALLGWSEVALHIAFLVPALAAATGTYFLARRWCAHPLEATLLGTMTPVFLTCSATVMCDTMMLAMFCWAVWCWMKGLEDERPGLLGISALLITAASLTKYFALSLIPLLIVCSLLKRKRLGLWWWPFVIPIGVLCAYQWWTSTQYGHGLLLDAASYSMGEEDLAKPNFAARVIIGLLFAGGCVIPALFYAPFLWSARTLLVAAFAFAVLGLLWGTGTHSVGPIEIYWVPSIPWYTKAQLLIAGMAGTSLIGLALAEAYRARDADSLLLGAWVLGTFVFASTVNWTNNGRSILPMAPVAGVLIVRQLETRFRVASPRVLGALRWAFVPGLAVALAVTWADSSWSNSIRLAANTIAARHRSEAGTLWFEGHWGFQYYMQKAGARALDLTRDLVTVGDRIVMPTNNVDVYNFPEQRVIQIDHLHGDTPPWIRTNSVTLGAGFYSSSFGPLPYAFGAALPDAYHVFLARESFRCALPPGRDARDELNR